LAPYPPSAFSFSCKLVQFDCRPFTAQVGTPPRAAEEQRCFGVVRRDTRPGANPGPAEPSSQRYASPHRGFYPSFPLLCATLQPDRRMPLARVCLRLAYLSLICRPPSFKICGPCADLPVPGPTRISSRAVCQSAEVDHFSVSDCPGALGNMMGTAAKPPGPTGGLISSAHVCAIAADLGWPIGIPCSIRHVGQSGFLLGRPPPPRCTGVPSSWPKRYKKPEVFLLTSIGAAV